MRMAKQVRTSGWRRLVVPLVCLIGWEGMAAATERPAPIMRIADIHKLSREEAARALPVRISGVVVWQRPGDGPALATCIVSDGENGVWVGAQVARDRGIWQCGEIPLADTAPGSQVDVEGVTDPGGYAPVILPTRIRRTGTAPLPRAERLPTERLLSGVDDCRLVMVEGVVQEIVESETSETAYLVVDGHACRVVAPRGARLDAAKLVDARVLVGGVFTPVFNYRSEAKGLKVLIQDGNDIEVLKPPLADPFQTPKASLSSIFQYSPDASPYHRKLIEGVVTFAVPGQFFFLQDGQSSVRVLSNEKNAKVGQRVEVAGFVDSSGTLAALKNGLVRKLGTAPVPEPQDVTAGQLLDSSVNAYWKKPPPRADFSGRLVRMKGDLRRVDWKPPLVPRQMRVESDGYSFAVNLPTPSALSPEVAKTWQEGAEVELTGICELEFKPARDLGSFMPASFHLWLASPQDMRILRQPSWWTTFRLLLALGSAGCVVAILLLWSWSLRRQVERQTRIIGDKGRMEAANAERARIARDLHDEIGANLTHISILSTLAAMPATEVETARRHSTEVAGVARQTIQAFDETLWSINPKNDTLQSLSHYIFRRTEEILAPANLAHHFDLDENLPDRFLPPQRRHGLLLAVKEALHNILKHAGATRVDIRCAVDGACFVVVVSDNGRGFDPLGIPARAQGRKGNGLDNMRGRLADLGGECRIESRPGDGTRILFLLPLDANPDPTQAAIRS